MYSTAKRELSKALRSIVSIMLIIALVLGMTACNGESEKNENNLDSILDDTASILLQSTTEPTFGSVGGEWVVFGLSRWGGEVPEGWFDTYYNNFESYVKSCNGILDERKLTEYSRAIITLTSIGRDPTNVAGYNLLTPLGDFEKTVFQGVNGAIYAVLALDSGNYEVPENTAAVTQATKDMYIDYILKMELENGGWALTGSELDADITAMALQALAKYQDRQDVKDATDRALEALSQCQNEDGGFSVFNAESSESIAQVIVALCELGISVDDERFVKNGKTLEDRLMDFRAEDGGFKHVLDGESDAMATEQVFYALVSINRVEQGQTPLYTM